MKCSLCEKEIKETFLGKPRGTYVKKKGKLTPVCSSCQKQYKDKLVDEIGKT